MARKKITEQEHSDLESLLKKYPHLADGETTSKVEQWIPTGSTQLDCILGGGIPIRRIIQILGEESSGKSALAGHIIGNCQKMGGIVRIDDSECTFDSDRSIIYGCDPEQIIYEQSATVEECFDNLINFIDDVSKIDTKIPICQVVDTLDAMMSEAEQGRTIRDSNTMGAEKAKKMSEAFRRLTNKIANSNTSLIILSQLRDKIGGYGGKSSSGGNAIKYFSSIRLELDMKQKIKNSSDIVVGIVTEAHTLKNKLFPPFKREKISIYFDRGIDDLISCFDYLIDNNVFPESGKGWYLFNDKKYHYKDLFRELIDQEYNIKERTIEVWKEKNSQE